MDNKKHIILIHGILQKLKTFCKTYNISTMFIVGDFCRERFAGRLSTLKEIEIFNAYPAYSKILATLFATEVLNVNPSISNEYSDLRIEYTDKNSESINLLFKSGILPGYLDNLPVKEWLTTNSAGSTPMEKYLCSKDFTINTLVYSFETGKMHDYLGVALKDFEKKNISPILPADLLVSNNPISILKAIQFSMQYDFFIDGKLKTEMRNKGSLLTKAYTPERIVVEIIKILQIGGKKGFEALKEYNLDSILTNPKIREYLDQSMENTNG